MEINFRTHSCPLCFALYAVNSLESVSNSQSGACCCGVIPTAPNRSNPLPRPPTARIHGPTTEESDPAELTISIPVLHYRCARAIRMLARVWESMRRTRCVVQALAATESVPTTSLGGHLGGRLCLVAAATEQIVESTTKWGRGACRKPWCGREGRW